jgi:hypothetical protein
MSATRVRHIPNLQCPSKVNLLRRRVYIFLVVIDHPDQYVLEFPSDQIPLLFYLKIMAPEIKKYLKKFYLFLLLQMAAELFSLRPPITASRKRERFGILSA